MNSVANYYNDQYDEHIRLLKRHSLERIRSQQIISRYIKNTGNRILDVGGATGIYSFWLAEKGNDVDLVDLSQKHIMKAKEIEKTSKINLKSIQLGNACELTFENDIYDFVLLMGPLYHLHNRIDRLRALSEAKRVLKSNGIIFIAAISKYASMFDGYIRNMIVDPEFYKIMKEDMKSGVHKNESKNPMYFTDAYFHHAKELKNEIEDVQLKCEKILPVEGFALCIADIENMIKNEEYLGKLLNDIEELENDDTIIGLSPHYLGIACK